MDWYSRTGAKNSRIFTGAAGSGSGPGRQDQDGATGVSSVMKTGTRGQPEESTGTDVNIRQIEINFYLPANFCSILLSNPFVGGAVLTYM